MGSEIKFNKAVVLFLFQFIAFLIIYSTFSSLYGKFIGESDQVKMIIKRLCELILYLMFIRFLHVNNKIEFNYNFSFNIVKLIISIIFIFSIIIAYQSSFDVIINKYLSLGMNSSGDNRMFSYVIPVAIQTCITAPICEGIIVRGYLLKILSYKYSLIIAIVLSSLFFAVLHFDFYNTIFYVIIGFSLSLVYIKTNSLLNTIIIHFMINAIAVASYYKNFDVSFKNINFEVLIISLLVVVISYILLNKTRTI